MIKLNKFLDLIENNDRASGTVLLYKNQKVLYERNFGLNIQDKSADRIYRLASISKTYTATIILKLIEENLLNLHTPVTNFFPDHENLKGVTIEHLLQHRSGIENYTARDDYFNHFEKGISRLEKLEQIKSYSNHFSPGEEYSYSNTGFFLLSVIAELITNKDFSEIILDKIVNPLKLQNTYLANSNEPRANEIDSFIKGTSWIKSSNTHHSIILGSGGIVSTANELAIFFEFLMTGKLLSDGSLKKMMAMVDNYGYGLTTFPFGNKTLYGHNGGVDGFITLAAFSPEDQLVYVMLTNASAFDTNLISITALSSYYGTAHPIPELEKSVSIADSELHKFTGDYEAKDFPLDFYFLVDNGSLYLHPKGQNRVPLEYFGNNTFKHVGLDVVLKFSDDFEQLQYTQEHLKHTYYKMVR